MMPNDKPSCGHNWYLPFIAACMAFIFSGTALGANNSYLDALEAEAAAAPTETQQAPEKAVSETEAKSLINKLPEGLTQTDLEGLLKDGFYGSYMFYNKLTSAQKETVYKQYQGDPTLKGVRDKIMELLKR